MKTTTVSKRLVAILAPFVVLVALAAMPAVSQAAPHYYRNGVLIPEGAKVPILEWGQLSFEPEPGFNPFWNCRTASGGYVENPVGGGDGTGAIEDFTAYGCGNAECPAGLIEIAGRQYEKVFQYFSPPQDGRWATALTEPEAGKTRTTISGVVLTAGCYATPLTRAEGELGKTTGPGEDELLPLAATATCVTTPSEHELTPLNEKGISASSPSKLTFDAHSGTFSCFGGRESGRFLKSLKVIGYTGSELITVKNP